MLLQFKTSDNSLLHVDIKEMTWKLVRKTDDPAGYVVDESGKLTVMGFGIYGLDGRQATDKDRPGAGLSVIGVLAIPLEKAITITVRGNVPLKELTMPEPITSILYQIV